MIRKSDWPFAYGLVAPAVILLFLIRVYPVVYGVVLSFTDASVTSVSKGLNFIGMKNYIDLFSDQQFFNAIGYTLVYVFGVVILSYAFGLFCAVILNGEIKGRAIFRAVLLVPWVIPGVVAVNSWLFAFNPQMGFINNFLKMTGLISSPVEFFGSELQAQFTVIWTSAWKSYPFMMTMMLAGLQNIPADLYESASIDGANKWHQFRKITLPLLGNVTMVSTTLMTIWNMNAFENIWLMTQGGPNGATYVIGVLAYYKAFFQMKLGYAAAMSTFNMVIMLVLSYFYIRIYQKDI